MGSGVSKPQEPPKFSEEHYLKLHKENGPHFQYLINEEKEIKFASKGIASKEESPAITLIDIFEGIIKKGRGDRKAFAVERPLPRLVEGKAPPPLASEDLTRWNFEDYYKEAKEIAAGLCAVGFQPFDAVCLFGFNCPEWLIGAMGAIIAGGAFTGIYPSDTEEQVNWKALLTNSSVAFAEDDQAAEKFLATSEELPYMKAIVQWNENFGESREPFVRKDGSKILRISWNALREMGKGCEETLEKRMKEIKPSRCADLIFTSGTTGNPKAVMISHDSIVCQARAMIKSLEKSFDKVQQHRILSYLPLSHIAGALVDIFLPIVFTHDMPDEGKGVEIYFARPYDLKVGSLVDRLKLCRPTIFLGVPRVWEKIMEKLLAVGKNIKGVKRKIANAAKKKALAYAEEQQVGHSGKIPFGYSTAKSLILDKIRDKLGLDQCQIGVTGAAPMKRETMAYFGSIGIQINEVYGMSETTGCATLTTPSTHLWGSAGYAVPGLEVEVFKVDPEDINKKVKCTPCTDLFNPQPDNEGEICFRGRTIMSGYMANPSLGDEHVQSMIKKNTEVMDEDGWLHSGDRGCRDVLGMFRITGRFKELIIGAGGENIAPVPIEDDIMKNFPAISNVVMIGDQRKFNVALVSIKAVGATGEQPGTDHIEETYHYVSDGVTMISQAAKDETWIKAITDAITKTNKNGAVCPSNAARIQKFTILPYDLSIMGGELTATLKIKRSVVEKLHEAAIEAMYNSKETYVPYPVNS